MSRHLVLFAREPAREARSKGFPSEDGATLFASFAAGWLDAAGSAGAVVVVATPAEDRPAWRDAFRGALQPAWIQQRGSSLGARLEHAAREARSLGGHAILVGGDVVPAPAALEAAFVALESGADAVLGPSPDGGLSLIGLAPEDLDLLRGVRERRRNLFEDLLALLRARGRRVETVAAAADVDGRADLRMLLRASGLSALLASAVRRALELAVSLPTATPRRPRVSTLHTPPALRGPPLPA